MIIDFEKEKKKRLKNPETVKNKDLQAILKK